MPSRPPLHRPVGWSPSVKRTDPFYQSRAWRRVRDFVVQRDGGICRHCGLAGADTAHHIVERRDGGSDDPANLAAVHRRCHNRAHPNKGGRHDV